MTFLFERLEVYQGAIDFAHQILMMTRGFPRRLEFLASQLGRAAVSVAANLAESHGRATHRDRRQYVVIARGSLMECVALLAIAARIGELDPHRHDQLRSEADRLARMLTGLKNRLSSN